MRTAHVRRPIKHTSKAVQRATSLALVAMLSAGCAQAVVSKPSSSETDHAAAVVRFNGPLPSVRLIGSAGLIAVPRKGTAVTATTTPLHSPSAELFGTNAPLGITGPAGIVYSSWTWKDAKYARADQFPQLADIGRPSVWLHTPSGSDQLIADGAQTPAVSSTGAIAYVSGGDYRTNTQYVGRIIVRQPDGSLQSWTPKAGAYTVLGWAGQRLIYALDPSEIQAAGAVYVADAPGRSRRIAEADCLLLATSPDHKWLLLSEGYLQGPPSLKVVEAATGRVVARLAAKSLAPKHVIANIDALGTWAPGVVWLAGDADGRASALSIQVTLHNGVPKLSHAVVHRIPGLTYTTEVQPWVAGSGRSGKGELVLGVTGAGDSQRYALAVCSVGGGCALR